MTVATSTVQYLVGPSLPFVGKPTLVVTYETAAAPTLYSEAFLFFEHRGGPLFRAQRWKVDKANIMQAGDPRPLLEGEAVTWASAEVEATFLHAARGALAALPSWHWTPVAGKPILRFWMLGMFESEIRGTCQHTKCDALKADLLACKPELKGQLVAGDIA